MFKTLYELVCGQNNDPIYATNVYPSVGLFTLLFSFAFAFIFYLLLGRWKPIWDKLKHWFITIGLLIAISLFFALTQAKGATEEPAYNSFMYKLALVNCFFAVIYFVIFSLLLKKASIFAKRTPF